MSERIDIAKIISLTGKSYRTVRKRLDDAGVDPVGKDGVSILFDSATALEAVFAGKNGDATGDLRLDQERALLAVEQRRKLERENNLAEQQIAPVEMLSNALSKVGAKIVAILEALPLEMKRMNPRLTGHDIMLTKKAIARCRNAIADIRLDDQE
jgi:phage terminase Nu1 subunit (DNA packaging protein)